MCKCSMPISLKSSHAKHDDKNVSTTLCAYCNDTSPVPCAADHCGDIRWHAAAITLTTASPPSEQLYSLELVNSTKIDTADDQNDIKMWQWTPRI